MHAAGLLSLEASKKPRCSMLDLFSEIDRLLRPEVFVSLSFTILFSPAEIPKTCNLFIGNKEWGTLNHYSRGTSGPKTFDYSVVRYYHLHKAMFRSVLGHAKTLFATAKSASHLNPKSIILHISLVFHLPYLLMLMNLLVFSGLGDNARHRCTYRIGSNYNCTA